MRHIQLSNQRPHPLSCQPIIVRSGQLPTLNVIAYIALITLIGFTSACTSPTPPGSCNTAADCSAGQLCLNSICATPQPDMAPPTVDCYQNADCGDLARCVEGACVMNECVDGEKRACESTCGSGEQLCSGGVWRACNNRPITEVCGTGEDEDCDGQADEGCGGCAEGEERVCMTECGEGRERCFGGEFRGCTAQRPRSEFCGDPSDPVDEDCDGMLDEGCADCEEGERRSCETECGVGEEVCRESTWRDCSARVPSDEICDNIDNDCDMVTDEDIVRSCENACGPGFERCETGAWTGCDAPENCDCSTEEGIDQQLCGACGVRTRMCDTPQWGEWGMCEMAGQCEPGQADSGPCGLCGTRQRYCIADCQWGEWQACLGEGVCEAGTVETENCPSGCGQRTRTCDSGCQWSEWSSCEGEGIECSPGDSEEESCGSCGEMRRRSCSAECRWEAWGLCESSGACTPGETEDRSCGACQTESRTCLNTCEWSEWGTCLEGTCAPGDTETRDCGLCGQQTRSCTPSCGWGTWSACQGEGVCNPGDEMSAPCGVSDVGACRLGTETQTCNSSCEWDSGDCRGAINPTTEICGSLIDSDCDGELLDNPDNYEPNNTCRTCFDLDAEPYELRITALIDSSGDSWDYFCFLSTDGSFNPTEAVEATLESIPSGADYDLFLYKSVADCEANNYLSSSDEGGNSNERVFWREEFGSDDTSTYVIGVRAFSNSYSCNDSYILTVSGL